MTQYLFILVRPRKRWPSGFAGSLVKPVILFLLVLPWLCMPLAAQQHSINPGINRHYQGAQHDDWMPVFETESREIYAKRHDIVAALGIKPGMRIADIGAGTGFFSLLFADQSGPRGLVYAVDITEDFVRTIEARAATAGIGNLVGVVNNGQDVGLAPDSIELAFICDTYHHFEYPQSTMRSIYRSLVAQGEVVIIDFRKDPAISSNWVRHHVRAGREQVIREMQTFGFELVADVPLLKTNYFLRFRKRQLSH